ILDQRGDCRCAGCLGDIGSRAADRAVAAVVRVARGPRRDHPALRNLLCPGVRLLGLDRGRRSAALVEDAQSPRTCRDVTRKATRTRLPGCVRAARLPACAFHLLDGELALPRAIAAAIAATRRPASKTLPPSAIIVRCGVPVPELYDVSAGGLVDAGPSRALVVANLIVGDGPRSFASFAGRLHSSSLSGWSRRSSSVRGSPPRRAQ